MKYRSRYEKLLGSVEPNDLGEVSIHCPFHEDQKRSASVNLRTGLFHCMACETSHNYISFSKAFEDEHGYPDTAATETDPEAKVIDDQVVRDLHFDLINNQEMIDRLERARGINLKTLQKWQIGWHRRTNRIAIPIRDEKGITRNIRLYAFDESGQQKMISWRAGFGTARLWPLEAFEEPYVILCEGEMDRLLLDQLGINAVTSTGGAKTWKQKWSKWFTDQKVRICYDMDDAGDDGARKAAASIAEVAREVKIIRLDLSKEGEDITNYFVDYGYTLDDFRDLSKAAPVFRKPLKSDDFESNGQPDWVTLGQSLAPEYRGKEVMVPVVVASRRDERLHYPKETRFSCNQDAGKMCRKCSLYGSGDGTVRIEDNDRRLTKMVGVNENQERLLVRKWAGIPVNCPKVEQQVVESGTIEEVLVTPELDTVSADDDSMHLIQRAFYIGIGLDYNSSYVMKIKPVPFHKNLKIVHQIIDAVPSHDSIDAFEVTPEVVEQLKIFQAEPGRAKRKLADIADQFSDHVTKIWDRRMLHIGMDLVWHSVLGFEFDNKMIRRGWLEAIVIGDTRTGKSEIATQYLRHFGYGEMVSGENTSYAGLVGGAVKFDEAWFVKWGRLPLNDRRLIVIDEITGMDVEDIAKMSNVREAGIADVTKIETQKAMARTRALWISNVRPPRQDLSDFDHGCLALSDIIGMPEDIARFDYAMSAARDEVSSAIVNQTHLATSDLEYTSDLSSLLIRWVWSRTAESIYFEQGAIDACYQHAIEMGANYDTALPLVMSENQRIKLARISAAIAGRLFSTIDGETLIVTAEHVQVARDLLDNFYSSPSFGYDQLSRRTKVDRGKRLEGSEAVLEHLKSRPELADLLTQFKFISPRQVASYTGMTEGEAEDSLRVLSKWRLTEDRGQHGRRVTAELKALAETVIPSEYSYGG